jgi:hypothetical protein
MCGGSGVPLDVDRLRDQHRGRSGTNRFSLIRCYAHKRWRKARNLRHALEWIEVARQAKQRDWLFGDDRGLW